MQAPNISGYALVDADITVHQNDEISVKDNADLKNTAIDFAYLGFVKPLNQNASASADVTLLKDKVKSVKNLKLQKSGFNIAGDFFVKVLSHGITGIHRIIGKNHVGRRFGR